MATQSTVTGPVQTPFGATPDRGYIRFQLTDWDAEGGTVITTTAVEEPIDVDTQDFSASLWASSEGDRGVNYKVTAVWYYDTVDKWVEDEIGYCEVGTSGPYALGDILVDDPIYPADIDYATAAATSAAEAAASAADAALYDGPKYDSLADMVAGSATFTAGTQIQIPSEGRVLEATDSAGDYANAGGQNFNVIYVPVQFQTVRLQQGKSSSYATFMGREDGDAARLYVEPSGKNSDHEGTAVSAAIKVFGDPYTDDARLAYRDLGVYIDKSEGTYPNIGIGLMNAKTGNDYWGLFFETGLSVQDAAAIPVRAGYINHDAAGDYFDAKLWMEGIEYTTGDYVLVGRDASDTVQGHIYQATTDGTSGSTRPTHTSGTASDGGVTWEFIEDLSATNNGYAGYAIIGDKDDKPLRGSNLADLGVVGMFTSPAVFGEEVRLYFAQAGNDDVAGAIWGDNGHLHIGNDQSGKHVRIGASDPENHALRFFDTYASFSGYAFAMSKEDKADGATALDATASNVVQVNDSSATTITSVSCLPFQPVFIRAATGNTTLEQGAAFELGGADLTLDAGRTYQFIGAGTSKLERVL